MSPRRVNLPAVARIPLIEEPIRRTVRIREAAHPVQLVVSISARRPLDLLHALAHLRKQLADGPPAEGIVDKRASRTIEVIIPRWPGEGHS